MFRIFTTQQFFGAFLLLPCFILFIFGRRSIAVQRPRCNCKDCTIINIKPTKWCSNHQTYNQRERQAFQTNKNRLLHNKHKNWLYFAITIKLLSLAKECYVVFFMPNNTQPVWNERTVHPKIVICTDWAIPIYAVCLE